MRKTKFTSHSPRNTRYTSTIHLASKQCEGVQFEIRRVSVRGRAELARDLSRILPQLEFHLAGSTPRDQLEATKLSAAAVEIYVRWGLVKLTGLVIDGEPATTESLLEKGPEGLCTEVAERIKRECGLTEDERKN